MSNEVNQAFPAIEAEIIKRGWCQNAKDVAKFGSKNVHYINKNVPSHIIRLSETEFDVMLGVSTDQDYTAKYTSYRQMGRPSPAVFVVQNLGM